MERDEAIKEAARAVRPYLESLLGQDRAGQLDLELARLLGATGNIEELLGKLQADFRTRQWWLDFVRCSGVPPEVAQGAGSVRSGLPGLGLPVLDRYACPAGDYVWYRRSPAIRVPNCPTHRVQLRAEPRTG
jgi:hypothetical protein